MQRGIVSAVDGRRARAKRPDGFVTSWMYISDSVAGVEIGDIVFYEPFGNDGLILHAIGGAGLDADTLDGLHAVAFATAAQGVKADAALPLSGGTLTGGIDAAGHYLKNYVEITASNGNTYETYPDGLSYSSLSSSNYEQNTGEDFPITTGTLYTVKYSEHRMFQILVAAGTFPCMYVRQYYEAQGGFLSWTCAFPSTVLLWSGSWTGSPATLTVNGFSNYMLCLVKVAGTSIIFPVVRANDVFRGSGVYALSTSHHEVSVNHSYSGNVLTWGYCNRFSHLQGDTHNLFSAYDGGSCTLSEIWGVA